MEKDKVKTLRVLVADDDQSNLNIYREILSQKDDHRSVSGIKEMERDLFHEDIAETRPEDSFDLTLCFQANQAVEAVRKALEDKNPFAMAFLDVRMPPGPDGVWAASRIREMDEHIELVIVTAYSDINPRMITSMVPPAHKLLYVQKPFHPQEIYQFATNLGSKWMMEKELRDSRNMLKMRVAEQTARLSEANEILKQEIFERKQAEEQLRNSEERFRSIVELISDWVWETDRKGFLTYISPRIKDFLGYEPHEVIGRRTYSFMTGDEALRVSSIFKDIGGHKKAFSRFDQTVIRKDGKQLLVETSGMPVFDAKGELTGWRGVDSDITERRQAEKEKEALEKRLRQSEKMEAVGALTSGVAHDLNNILSGIINYPEMILMDLPEDSSLRRPILAIQKSGQKAAAIVQDMLTLARRGVAVSEVFDLNELITEYISSPEYARLQDFHPDITLETTLANDLDPVTGSPLHLSKTIMNLVSNAAEAIGDTGKITISTENIYLDAPVKGYSDVDKGDYVSFSVSDNGMGIPEEDIVKIFEPFYTKKKMGRSGTGLGMSVVWATAKDHKGYIYVKSHEGEGTTITLYLPRSEKKPAGRQPKMPFKDHLGKGESILVVDDVDEQRQIATEMLMRLGYSVTSVSSGEEAVEYMKSHSADLILLDMIMPPGIDGLDTYKKILETHPAQKAIIASGFSESERVKEIQRLGAGVYIKKPYTFKKIGIEVRAELDRRRAA